MFVEVVELVKSIPVIMWSGVVGAFLALAGVMLSNSSGNRRLEIQLRHDAQERAKDKISNLRKEVYLKAVEDIALVNVQISTVANRDLTKLDIGAELQTISASMEKVRIVGEGLTAKVAEELGCAYGILIVSLLPKIVSVQSAQLDIDINDSGYNKAFAESTRVLGEIQRFNEAARQDVEIFQALQRSYQWFSNRSQEYLDARGLAYQQRDQKLREFSEALLPEMKEISKIQLKLIASIRGELGLPVDLPELQRRLERHWNVMAATYGDAMKGVQAEISESNSEG